VGLFVAIAAAAVVATITYRLVGEPLFRPKATLGFVAASGTGLRPGMAVKLKGFPVGRLTHLALDPAGEVEATLAVERRYLRWLGRGSEAVWTPAGPLGDGTIELIPAATSAPPLASGDRLPFRRRTGVGDLLGQLGEVQGLIAELRDARLGETLTNARLLSEGMAASRTHLERTLDRAEATLDHMDRVVDEAGETIAHTDRTAGKADTLIDHMESTAGHLGRVAEGVETSLPPLIARTETLLTHLEGATAHLAEAAERAPALAANSDALATEARATLRETRTLLKAIGEVWPIRSHLPSKSPE